MDYTDVIEQSVQILCTEAEKAYANDNRDLWSEKRSQGKSLLEENGFEYLGLGDYRFVYAIPAKNLVVKIAKNNLGRTENEQEMEHWQAAPSEVREYLAESFNIDSQGRYLVQQRVDDTAGGQDAVQQVKDVLKAHGMHISEITLDNVGQHPETGKPIAYDYAGK